MGNLDMSTIGALNSVDIAIIAIIAISVIIGFGRGLISEVLSLLIWVAAFVVSILFTSKLADYFSSIVTHQATNSEPASYVTLGISFAVLFIGTLLIGSVIKMLLNAILQGGFLGFGNRLLGALFGLARGYLFVLVLIFLVQLSPLAKEPWWQASQYVPKFQPQIVWLGDHISPTLGNLKETFTSTIQEVTQAVHNYETKEKQQPMSSQPVNSNPQPAATEPVKTDQINKE